MGKIYKKEDGFLENYGPGLFLILVFIIAFIVAYLWIRSENIKNGPYLKILTEWNNKSKKDALNCFSIPTSSLSNCQEANSLLDIKSDFNIQVLNKPLILSNLQNGCNTMFEDTNFYKSIPMYDRSNNYLNSGDDISRVTALEWLPKRSSVIEVLKERYIQNCNLISTLKN